MEKGQKNRDEIRWNPSWYSCYKPSERTGLWLWKAEHTRGDLW